MQLDEFSKSRGFDTAELERYGVRCEGSHVVIPLLGRDGVWHERTRCLDGNHPKYNQPKGDPLHLYNPLGLGPHSPEIWVAEGELDTLSLICVGAPALGILGVDGFNMGWQHIFGGEIVLALDPDGEGQKATEKFLDLWPDATVFEIPAPYEDINDWFKQDRAGLEGAILAW